MDNVCRVEDGLVMLLFVLFDVLGINWGQTDRVLFLCFPPDKINLWQQKRFLNNYYMHLAHTELSLVLYKFAETLPFLTYL